MGSKSIGAILLQKDPKDPSNETSLFCEPSDEAHREGLILDVEKMVLALSVCYSKILGIPFAPTLRNNHYGGYLSTCFTAHGCFCSHF